MHTIVQRLVGVRRYVTAHQWVALLLARLAIGFFFLMSGYNKLFVHSIKDLQEGFVEWGLPWPWLSAWMDVLVQLIGGFAIMVGLGTRLWSLLIGFAMVVASVVATIPDVLRKISQGPRIICCSGGGFITGRNPFIYGLALVDLSRPGQGQSGSGDCL